MTAHVEYGEGFPNIPSWHEVPFFKPQKKIVLRNCGLISPDDIEEYVAIGGYQALYKVLIDNNPEMVIEQIKASKLRGRGVGSNSEMVYHSIKEDLTKQGVIFTDPETAVREHPDLVKQYFGTVIPYLDNKFAALNSAVWSGGSFVYVPKGVKVDVPLQAYFRINAKSFGQFERTLIIADEGSFVHYIEGCTAPIYATESLHSAVVEIIALPGLAGALHDHPELVQRRVQPRHQARRGAQGRHRGVGGRQHRVQADHEVPLDLAHGRRGARRGPLHRVRGQGPGAGHRRQGGARGQPHLLGDHGKVHQQGRRHRHVPRAS